MTDMGIILLVLEGAVFLVCAGMMFRMPWLMTGEATRLRQERGGGILSGPSTGGLHSGFFSPDPAHRGIRWRILELTVGLTALIFTQVRLSLQMQ